jgi:hypothetical protein
MCFITVRLHHPSRCLSRCANRGEDIPTFIVLQVSSATTSSAGAAMKSGRRSIASIAPAIVKIGPVPVAKQQQLGTDLPTWRLF